TDVGVAVVGCAWRLAAPRSHGPSAVIRRRAHRRAGALRDRGAALGDTHGNVTAPGPRDRGGRPDHIRVLEGRFDLLQRSGYEPGRVVRLCAPRRGGRTA